MNNRVFCSTGAFIGPYNNFDYYLIPETARRLHCDGLELMVEPALYDIIPDAPDFLAKSGVKFGVIHSDKRIGVMLSDGGEENRAEAFRRLELCSRAGEIIGAEKLVLHLWGGPGSDNNIPYMLDALEEMYGVTAGHGLELVVENVPCVHADPLTHWKEIVSRFPDAGLIFDTRFGALHEQLDDVFDQGWFDSGNIRHMHVSDFAGPAHSFKALRPIYMPGEGTIGKNFRPLLQRISSIYSGTVTLESPALGTDGRIDIDALNRGLDFINDAMK